MIVLRCWGVVALPLLLLRLLLQSVLKGLDNQFLEGHPSLCRFLATFPYEFGRYSSDAQRHHRGLLFLIAAVLSK